MVRPANIVFLIALFLGGWRALLSAQEEPPADGIEGVIEAGKAVELSPKQHKCLDTLTEVNFRLENREKAVEVAKEGLKISPEDEHLKAQLKRFESEGTKE
jgi:hypothetical protein